MSLIAEQLGREIANVSDFDFTGSEVGFGEAAQDGGPHGVGDLQTAACPVVGEVALITAKKVDA